MVRLKVGYNLSDIYVGYFRYWTNNIWTIARWLFLTKLHWESKCGTKFQSPLSRYRNTRFQTI